MLIEMTTLWLVSAAAVPADAAENSHGPPASAGVVAPGPLGEAPLTALLQAIRADAAKRRGLDAARLVVLPVEEVTWSDSSLGCPQANLVYTHALVPGWRIRIEAGAEVLSYHASRRGPWLLCPAGRAVAPTPGVAPR